MARDRLRFRSGPRSPQGPRLRLMASMLGLVALGTWWMARSRDPSPVDNGGHDRFVDEVVVEVRGQVPNPGFHAVPVPATVGAALSVAGLEGVTDDTSVQPGGRIDFDGKQAHLSVMEDTLVVGLPLDLNAATAASLQALPGIGPARAEAIVAERVAGGPFETIDALTRVKGIGPKTVEDLRPFLRLR